MTAAPRPGPATQVRLLQGRGGRRGWYGAGSLWADAGAGDWLLVDRMSEREAFRFLDTLDVRR